MTARRCGCTERLRLTGRGEILAGTLLGIALVLAGAALLWMVVPG